MNTYTKFSFYAEANIDAILFLAAISKKYTITNDVEFINDHEYGGCYVTFVTDCPEKELSKFLTHDIVPDGYSKIIDSLKVLNFTKIILKNAYNVN
jgi:hypothetical protein